MFSLTVIIVSDTTKSEKQAAKKNSAYSHGLTTDLIMLTKLHYYRSGTVNSKSFVGKVFLRIKWKFELINAL